MRKKVIYLLLIILLIIIEQAIKNVIIAKGNSVLINNVLNITYTENTGLAFGIGRGYVNFLIVVNIVVLAIVLILAYTNKNFKIGTILILAGGLSNLYDRILRGFVVDYIDITSIISFPIFNLADVFIVIGAILFVISTYGGKHENI